MRQLERAKKAGRKFLNPVETQMGGIGLMLKVLPMYFANKEETEPRKPLGPFRTDASTYRLPPATGLRVTWFGHSSSLVEIDDVTILIDPVWDQRAAPVSWFGPKRFFAPTLTLDDLPEPDAVLISHDHYDHLGAETVKALARIWPSMRWVCPLGVGAVLRGFGVAADCITELDWTESVEVTGKLPGARLTLTALPTRHFSGRSLSNRFETLWASYVLKGSTHSVYFGADTGLWDGIASIAAHYGPFDLTMLEIGAFHPLWAAIHMGPDGATSAFEILGGGVFMPIHWGLFNLAMHAWRQPIERVNTLAEEKQIALFAPRPGVPTEFRKGEALNVKWWQQSS